MTVNENNPLDQEIPTRPDGLNNILAAHITGRACKLAIASDEQQVRFRMILFWASFMGQLLFVVC